MKSGMADHLLSEKVVTKPCEWSENTRQGTLGSYTSEGISAYPRLRRLPPSTEISTMWELLINK